MSMRSSSRISRLRVDYVSTVRKGAWLKMHVHRGSNADHSVQENHSARYRSPSSAASTSFQASSAIDSWTIGEETDFTHSVQFDDEYESDINLTRGWFGTHRFTDANLERDYICSIGASRIASARYLAICAGLYFLSLGFDTMTKSPSSLVSIGASYGGFLFFVAVAVYTLHGNHFTRFFFRFHKFSFILSSTFFALARYGVYDETVAGDNYIAILAFIIVIPGDGFSMVCTTIYANLFVFFMTISKTTSLALYRVTAPLILLSVSAAVLSLHMDMHRRRSFFSLEKMHSKHQSIRINQKTSKRILENLYPRPVVESLLGTQSSEKCFSAPEASVMMVQLAVSQNIIIQKAKQRVVGIFFEYLMQIADRLGLHRIREEGNTFLCSKGIFECDSFSARDCCQAAWDLMQVIRDCDDLDGVKLKISISTGSLCGGFIKCSKQGFDVFGDAVQTAERNLVEAAFGQIVVDQKTWQLTKDMFVFQAAFQGAFQLVLQANSHLNPTSYNVIVSEKPTNASFAGEMMSEESMTKLEIAKSVDKQCIFHRRFYVLPFYKFLGASDDEDYKVFLRSSVSPYQKRIGAMMTLLLCVVYGFVYLTLYQDIDIPLSISKYVLHLRFFVLAPLLALCILPVISSSDGRGYENQHESLLVLQSISTGLYILYVTASSAYLYNDRDLTDNYSYYTLGFITGELHVCITLSIVDLYSNLGRSVPYATFWMVLFSFYQFVYGTRIGLPTLIDQLLGAFIQVWTMYFAAYIMFMIKERESRRAYLYARELSTLLKKASFEKDYTENMLLSVASHKMVKVYREDPTSYKERFKDAAILVVSLEHPELHQKAISEEFFESLSEYYQRLEKVCSMYKVEMIRANSKRLMFISRSSSAKDSAHLTRLIDFALQILRDRDYHVHPMSGKPFSMRMAVDIGNASSYIIGKERFTSYISGRPVDTLLIIVNRGQENQLQVSMSVRSLLLDNRRYVIREEKQPHPSSEQSVISCFYLEDVSFVWAEFMSHVDWLDECEMLLLSKAV
eukprot:TRINITY_DN3555_c0_g1_i7.p1 TRINITY_DN3555_c0_g1~~TRINITY_DN3555_c0_g1_i7.p1  ORF type:complete len:1021 (+),score=167.76 TRINITY_DN3555_c0_g1_i7:49-3111(+)